MHSPHAPHLSWPLDFPILLQLPWNNRALDRKSKSFSPISQGRTSPRKDKYDIRRIFLEYFLIRSWKPARTETAQLVLSNPSTASHCTQSGSRLFGFQRPIPSPAHTSMMCFHSLFVLSGMVWSLLKSSCPPAEPVPALQFLPTRQVQFMSAKSLLNKESKRNKDMKELLTSRLQLETAKRYVVMFSSDSQLLPLGGSCPVFKDTRRVN